MDSLDHYPVDRDRRIAGIAFGRSPFPAAITLIDGYRIRVYVPPRKPMSSLILNPV